ncbi:bactericidal permeability-increasing protein-like [Rhinophrynus dorsalis]
MFGKVEYTISGVLIKEFEFLHTSALPAPPANVNVSIESANAQVCGQWHVKHWLVKSSGTFTLMLSGISIVAQLTTLKDSTGRPSVERSTCHSEVNNAKIHLSGGASWLFNLFTVFLEKPIRNNVNKKLCPRVDKAITILQKELSTFQVSPRLDSMNEIDYVLISPPRVEKTHIDLDLKGTIHPIGSAPQESYPVSSITLPDGKESMIYLGISEYFFNFLGKIYFNSNVLKLTLSQEQFPHAFWLRTGDYGAVIPQMSDYFSESQAMILTVTATKSPVVSLTPGKVKMEMNGLLEALVVLPYFVTKQVFSADLEATLIADSLHLADLNLDISFVIERFQFHEFRSSVGKIDVEALESSMGRTLQESILRAINSGLRRRIPMPSLANITLQESDIKVTQGSLLVSMNMYYLRWKEIMDSVHNPEF